MRDHAASNTPAASTKRFSNGPVTVMRRDASVTVTVTPRKMDFAPTPIGCPTDRWLSTELIVRPGDAVTVSWRHTERSRTVTNTEAEMTEQGLDQCWAGDWSRPMLQGGVIMGAIALTLRNTCSLLHPSHAPALEFVLQRIAVSSLATASQSWSGKCWSVPILVWNALRAGIIWLRVEHSANKQPSLLGCASVAVVPIFGYRIMQSVGMLPKTESYQRDVRWLIRSGPNLGPNLHQEQDHGMDKQWIRNDRGRDYTQTGVLQPSYD